MTESPFEPPSGETSAEPFTPPYQGNQPEPAFPAQQAGWPQQPQPQQPQQSQQPYGPPVGFGAQPQQPGYWQQPVVPAAPAGAGSHRALMGVLGAVTLIAVFGIGLATGRATAPKAAAASPIAGAGDTPIATSGLGTAAAQAAASAGTAGASAVAGNIVSALIPLPAGGSALKVPDASANGAMNLDQFIKQVYTGSSSERGLLQARGFESAAARWMNTATGQEDYIYLVVFGSPDGAQSYALGAAEAHRDDPTHASDTKFNVPALTDGAGFENPALDSYGNADSHIYGSVGDVAILVESFTPAELNRAEVLALVDQQATRLSTYEQQAG